MNGNSVTPVQVLRDHASRVEAAVSVALAKPKPRPVHTLRSETRRVEAQLDLLAMLDHLPSYRAQADKVLGRLKKLRSIAGKVRDCDVQRKLLKNGDAQLTSAPEAPRGITKDSDGLRKLLGKARDRNEKKLIAAIRKHQPKLTGDIEMLLDALKAGEAADAPTPVLLNEIEERFKRLANAQTTGEEHLHELRKTAKRARYQCESLPGEQAAAMAKQFEAMQNAGGAWHDFLELARRSHNKFGPEHPLSRVLEHRRDQRLDQYCALLDQFKAAHPAPEKPQKRSAPKSKKRSAAGHRASAPARKRASSGRSGKNASARKSAKRTSAR